MTGGSTEYLLVKALIVKEDCPSVVVVLENVDQRLRGAGGDTSPYTRA
jgi:hypothetical protein